MMTDKLQHQRLELKYVVHEQVALAVRDFVAPHLMLDEYGKDQPDFSYPIHSLYLDSDRLSLYWETITGSKNRYKLRLRYYDDSPASPVFFEIKRRMNDAILKQRGGVKRTAVVDLLAGQMPDVDELFSSDPKHLTALENFCRLRQLHNASPKAHVSYRREAWISPINNSVRVTMDRQIELALQSSARLQTTMERPVSVFGKSVVLELKFTGRFPTWFGELARHFGLWQCSAAKYADGITLLREAGRSPLPVVEPETFEAAKHLQSRREFLNRIEEGREPAFA